MNPSYTIRRAPERIVCLTEEPTEILYALGQSERIVGISAYTVRPPEAARDKPVVSAFIGGSVKKIAALRPDLVIGFSDIQADLARDLIKENLPVLIFNQRSIQEILDVILRLGALVDAIEQAHELVRGYIKRLDAARERAEARGRRPRVYFEEWDDPLICGIQWVSEIIEIAGGHNVFADQSRRQTRARALREPRSDHRSGPRDHLRLVVRQARTARSDTLTRGLPCHPRRRARPPLRDRSLNHLAAWPRLPDRRPRRNRSHHCACM